MLYVILTPVLAYLALCVIFLTTVFALGLGGRQETVLPRWLARPIRLLAYPWLRGWATGITVGYATVFMIPPFEGLQVHEATHRAQSAARAAWLSTVTHHLLPWAACLVLGALVQMVCYGWEFIRHGYINNRYEVEARKAAGEE